MSVSPDGEMWVERHVKAGAPRQYDVFGTGGERLRSMILPESRRIVGFGDGVVYLARTDEVDLQWLERYKR